MIDRDLWSSAVIKQADGTDAISVDVSADFPEGTTAYYLVWMAIENNTVIGFSHTFSQTMIPAANSIHNFAPAPLRFLVSAGDLSITSSVGGDRTMLFIPLEA